MRDSGISNWGSATQSSGEVYYTTTVVCHDTDDTGSHGDVVLFEESRSKPILANTNSFEIAVESAVINTKALPSFIVENDETSDDPNKLTAQVGLALTWKGSLYPTQNTPPIPNPDGNQQPPLQFISTQGSYLPIRYFRRGISYNYDGSPQSNFFNYGTATVGNYLGSTVGIMQAFRQNDPNSCEWTGQYVINPTAEVFLASFQRAIERAFGSWYIYKPTRGFQIAITSYDAATNLVTATASAAIDSNAPGKQFCIQNGGVGNGFSVSDLTPKLIEGFFIVNSLPTSNTLTFKPTSYMAEAFINGDLNFNNGFTYTFDLYWPGSYLSSPNVYVPPITSVGTYFTGYSDDHPIVEGGSYIKFSTGAGISSVDATTSSIFDFYDDDSYGFQMSAPGVRNNLIFWDPTTLAAITPIPLTYTESPYISFPPNREDFMRTALLLGFAPNSSFIVANNSAYDTYPPRPICAPFISEFDLGSYRNLSWIPQDEFAITPNPAPGSDYYYAYGHQYFIDTVVNPAFAKVVSNADVDGYFSSNLEPWQVLQTINDVQSDTTVTSIGDLSLGGQLYCMQYYNSCNAGSKVIQGVFGTSSGSSINGWTYTPGILWYYYPNLEWSKIGAACVYPDPNYPNQLALWICNKPNGVANVQPPSFSNTYWVYCGAYLPHNIVIGATYPLGECATYCGIVYKCTAAGTYTGGTPGTSGTATWSQTGILVNPPIGILPIPPRSFAETVFTLLPPPPVIGSNAPVMVLNSDPGNGGTNFQFRLDSMSYGVVDYKNPKSALCATQRDSWGYLGFSVNSSFATPALTYIPTRLYDEFMLVQSNTAFKTLFNGFAASCRNYRNPSTGSSSAIWDYNFFIDPTVVPEPPLPVNIVFNNPTTSYAAYRMSDPQVYYYSFTSSETSRYSAWSPVHSIAIELTSVPIDDQPVSAVHTLTEATSSSTQVLTSADTRRIVAEFPVAENPCEATIRYEPKIQRILNLMSGGSLKQFGYRMYWRNRLTGSLVPLKLSSGGSATVVFKFVPK